MKHLTTSSVIVLGIIAVFISCAKPDLTNTAPTLADQTFTVSEQIPIGTTIGTLEASDADGDPLTYSLVSGNPNQIFSIHSATGVLVLEKALDFRLMSTHTLEVEVSDGEALASATVTIQITPILPTGLLDETLQHDNLQREYLLYVPTTVTGTDPMPLVFSLHGAGGTKESQYALSQFNVLADRENFILVTPEATPLRVGNLAVWNQQSDPNRADDVGFIQALIQEVAGRYPINLDRVYLAGSSNGAFMALEATCRLSDQIAATAAVKGYMSTDQINACQPTTPTAILQLHGTADPMVPYSNVQPTVQFWTTFNQTDATPTTTARPDTDPNNGNTTNSYRYPNGTNGVVVEHLEVVNGEHDWFGEPGTNYDIQASEEAWAFFAQFDVYGRL